MAEPQLLPGNRFRAYRLVGGSPKFVCLATAITLTQTNAFEDATVADCDDPLAIPDRKSVKTSKSWGGRFAGSMAADHLAEFQADNDAEDPVPYEFQVDRTALQGGGKWTGDIFVENFEVAKNNNGIVTFTVQFRGDGPLDWVSAT